jgi:DNA-directed RNA polymerase
MKARILELKAEGLNPQEIMHVLKAEGLNTKQVKTDKMKLVDRAQWTIDNLDRIKSYANNPTKNTGWTEADQPIQFLKACKDYTKYTEHMTRTQRLIESNKVLEDCGLEPKEVPEYKSHISVDKDGTCSGIQIYSLMYRDSAAAYRVNVAPTPEPQDIYDDVADETLRIMTEYLQGNTTNMRGKVLENRPEASRIDMEEWLKVGITRSETKRIVMCLTYGLTGKGIRDYSFEALEEVGREKFKDPSTAGLCFAAAVTAALDIAATSAVTGMHLAQRIARYMARVSKKMIWTTPPGFKAIRTSQKMDEETIQVVLSKMKSVETTDGDRVQVAKTVKLETVVRTPARSKTGKLVHDSNAMSNASAPDLIHSLDAALLMLTVEKSHQKGIKDLKLVHDSFGTHAADIDALDLSLREAAYEMFGTRNYIKEWVCEVVGAKDWEEAKLIVNTEVEDRYVKQPKALEKARSAKTPCIEKIAELEAKHTKAVSEAILKHGIKDSDVELGDFKVSSIFDSEYFCS